MRVPPEQYTEGLTNVFQYVTNNGGAAYSDNVGLMLITGKKLWSTDPFTQTHATRYGRWDESKLVEAILKKQFSQIVLRIDIDAPDAGAGDVSPGILQAVRDNYKLDQRNVENIYVPRRRGASKERCMANKEAQVPQELLDILVCPVDKAKVHLEGDRLICEQCGTRLSRPEGIPIMLEEEAEMTR